MDIQTHIVFRVQTQGSCKIIMQTQGSYYTTHIVIIVQTQGSCNFNNVVQYSADPWVMQLKSDEHIWRINCSSLVYHMWWLSGLRGYLVIQQPDAHLFKSRLDQYFFLYIVFLSCQFQKMYKYAKFDQNIWCGSRVMSFFTKRPQLAKMMLSRASSPFVYQWLGNVKINKFICCFIWSKYTMRFKSYEHFH